MKKGNILEVIVTEHQQLPLGKICRVIRTKKASDGSFLVNVEIPDKPQNNLLWFATRFKLINEGRQYKKLTIEEIETIFKLQKI